jgi:hypothetical protein
MRGQTEHGLSTVPRADTIEPSGLKLASWGNDDMASAAERRIKFRTAAEIERAAYDKFMKEVGVPLLKADAVTFERHARTKTKNRHQLEHYLLTKAAELADLAEAQQESDHGAANTGGAALVARTLRALAGPSKALKIIDEMFLTDWEPMDTAPKDGRAIIIATGAGGVGEAKFIEDAGWYWAGGDPTDAHDTKVYDPIAWQPMPAPLAKTGGHYDP